MMLSFLRRPAMRSITQNRAPFMILPRYLSRWQKLALDAKQNVPEVSPQLAQQKCLQRNILEFSYTHGENSPKFIDVREIEEWNFERIAGAIHVARGTLEREIERLFPDPETEMIIYCAGGTRSALVVENLKRMGYTRAFSLAGGLGAWKRMGLPIKS